MDDIEIPYTYSNQSLLDEVLYSNIGPGTVSTASTVYTINTPLTTGTSGSVLMASSVGYDWNLTSNEDLAPNTLNVSGNANFDSDITLQGKSLKETLDNIEKRLAILHPNPELEEKWENLKALGQMYRELEAEIIEKESMWAILRK